MRRSLAACAGRSARREKDANTTSRVPVALQLVPRHEDASIVDGVPVIQLDAGMIDRIPPIVAEFPYFHECGHHALGHIAAAVVNGPYFTAAFSPQAEYEADYFGLAAVKKQGAMLYTIGRHSLMQAGGSTAYDNLTTICAEASGKRER